MKLYRGGTLSFTYRCVKSEEAMMYGHQGGVRVGFTSVGEGTERHSDFSVGISFVDVLHILTRMQFENDRAKDLHDYAYERAYYAPRYPMPTTISHWCNVLMTEVRKEGYL